MAKKKYTKIGAVLEGQYGPFAILGNTKSKKEEYNYDVQIMVKNSKGEKVALVKNPLLSLSDPRKFQKEGEERNIPDKLLFDLLVVEEQE